MKKIKGFFYPAIDKELMEYAGETLRNGDQNVTIPFPPSACFFHLKPNPETDGLNGVGGGQEKGGRRGRLAVGGPEVNLSDLPCLLNVTLPLQQQAASYMVLTFSVSQ